MTMTAFDILNDKLDSLSLEPKDQEAFLAEIRELISESEAAGFGSCIMRQLISWIEEKGLTQAIADGHIQGCIWEIPFFDFAPEQERKSRAKRNNSECW